MKIGMITDSLGAPSFGELLGTAAHPGLRAGHPMDAANDWQDPDAALGASVNYMMLTGYDCGGWQMALAARSRIGSGTDEDFCRAKIATASFYAEQILPKADALLAAIKSGASTALALAKEQF